MMWYWLIFSGNIKEVFGKQKEKNEDRISTCEFKRKGKIRVKKNEKCDVKAKLDMHLNADLKLVEAKCTWELGKGLGLC